MDKRIGTLMALVAALAYGGCAGYAGDVKEIRSSLIAGDKARALEMANQALDVDASNELPRKVGGDNALLVLERATVKQGLGRHRASTVDFQVADQHLELLDLKNDTAGNIGKWLFSDDVTVYKAPPHEKLLLNTLNMLNYLALGNLEEARVEARRLRVMRRHLTDAYSEQEARLGLGSYLAGFTFEMSGRHEEALRSYDEALAAGDYESLAGPVRRLASCSKYRSKRIERLLPPPPAPEPAPEPPPAVAADAGPENNGEPVEPEPPAAPAPAVPEPICEPRPSDTGTVLVVTSIGLAPYKEATRIPIGAALVVAGHVMYGPGLGMGDSAKAQELAAKGGGAAGGLALLAGLAVEGALTAADTPDTRSWVTLPAHVVLSRAEVPAGRHKVVIRLEGPRGTRRIVRTIDVEGGGFGVVSVAAMR